MWFLCLLGVIRLSIMQEVPQNTGAVPASSYRFRAQKYALLLAYFALFPQKTHRREELVALFWPDAEDETAGRICLRTALASLRRLLTAENPNGPADPFITRDRETIQLHPHVLVTDVGQFERLLRRANAANVLPQQRRALLEKALGLYGGPLLPGSDVPWVLVERDRLENSYESAKAQLLVLSQTASLTGPRVALAPISIQIPVPISRFWGRDAERETLRGWLTDSAVRLITLTGSGGMGKTRLAIEAARDIATQTRCFTRVVFVPLTAYGDASLLPEAVLAALSFGAGDKDTEVSGMEALIALLREAIPMDTSRILLVLDNFEHLLGSTSDIATRFVQTLLASVPGLVLIITSRQRLLLSGERELPLMGLPTDQSAAFLVDRARGAGRPDWGGTGADTAIREVVTTLEGIPLALELVAGWAALLSPRQMQERLTARMGSLFGSPLTIHRRGENEPTRHRSLRAALDWGGDDLPVPTQRFFVGMATVFRGGCTLPAICDILLAPGETEESALYHLARLQDHSLLSVRNESADDTARYHLLEVIREWAIERFADIAAPQEELRSGHFHYFMAFADREAIRAGGPDSAIAFARLEAEEANLIAALDFGITSSTSEDLLIALNRADRLRWCWWVRGRRAGLAMLRRQIPLAWESRCATLSPTSEACTELFLATEPYLPDSEAETRLYDLFLQFETGEKWERAALICERLAQRLDTRQAETQTISDWMNKAALLRERIGDMVGLGYTLANWAGFYMERGERDHALPLLYRCRELALLHGDRARGDAAKIGIALAGNSLSVGNLAEAESLAREAVTVFAERGETWNHADALKLLASTLLAQGEHGEQIMPLLIQSHSLFQQAGDDAQASGITALQKHFLPR